MSQNTMDSNKPTPLEQVSQELITDVSPSDHAEEESLSAAVVAGTGDESSPKFDDVGVMTPDAAEEASPLAASQSEQVVREVVEDVPVIATEEGEATVTGSPLTLQTLRAEEVGPRAVSADEGVRSPATAENEVPVLGDEERDGPSISGEEAAEDEANPATARGAKRQRSGEGGEEAACSEGSYDAAVENAGDSVVTKIHDTVGDSALRPETSESLDQGP